MGIEINAVVNRAAALADERQFQAIEESQTATDIGRGFPASEVANRRGRRWKFSHGIGRCWL